MKITNPVLTVVFGLLVAGAAAKAEDSAAKISEIQINMMRKDLRDQTKQVVAANLPLTGDEAAKFWPLYDVYTKEFSKLYDQRFTLVKAYADTYNTMTDTAAGGYIRDYIRTDEAASKLRLEWIPKFEQLIGEKKAAIFFQIDRRVGLMRELQLAAQLPLVQP